METALRSIDDEIHDAEEAPPRTRIYLRADEDGRRMLEAATTFPPAGPLDGWMAVDVDAEVWDHFDNARDDYDRAARRLKQADEHLAEARMALEEQIDR